MRRMRKEDNEVQGIPMDQDVRGPCILIGADRLNKAAESVLDAKRLLSQLKSSAGKQSAGDAKGLGSYQPRPVVSCHKSEKGEIKMKLENKHVEAARLYEAATTIVVLSDLFSVEAIDAAANKLEDGIKPAESKEDSDLVGAVIAFWRHKIAEKQEG